LGCGVIAGVAPGAGVGGTGLGHGATLLEGAGTGTTAPLAAGEAAGALGATLGAAVGPADGAADGPAEGAGVGAAVGPAVGAGLGASVATPATLGAGDVAGLWATTGPMSHVSASIANSAAVNRFPREARERANSSR